VSLTEIDPSLLAYARHARVHTCARVYKIKPDIERVQALADISRSGYVVIATKPVHDCKSAQWCTTRGHPYHSPKLHPGPCSSMGMRRGKDRDTQTCVTNIHFASSTTHAKC